MASNQEFFKFNLIPPKSKEELVVLEERDNSVFYSSILVFIGLIIFIILTLVQSLVIAPRVIINKELAASNEIKTKTYNNVRELHGELYNKAQSLDFILERDIKLTQLLEISDQLRNGSNAEIISYSREGDGKFKILLNLDDYNSMNQIFNNAKKISVLKDFFLENIVSEGKVKASVSFYITNIKNGQL